MPFNHSILISLQDKVTKNLNKINKKLILISKTAKKSTDKINKSLKKLKLKQTFKLNIKKALKSLGKLKDKIKDIGRTLKNKIKMPKLSGVIGGIGGFLGLKKIINIGLDRERATKEWRKVKPAKISETGAKNLKLQAEGSGAWNSKFPLLGSFEDTRATQAEIAKLGVGEKQILSMTKTAMIAKMAWNTPVKFFIQNMGKIFDVFRINRKDFSKNAKVIGNQIDYIADKTGNVIHKDVVDVLTRTSGSLRLLGFKMRKSIGVASWASTTATHPELAASGFNAFVRELTTQMNVDKLGYNPGYKEYIQQATSGKDRANRLGNLIEHLQKLTPDTLYKLFTKQTAGWLIQIKGATKKLREISNRQDDKDAKTALDRALKIESSGFSGLLARTQKKFKNVLTQIYEWLKDKLSAALELIGKGLNWLIKNPRIFGKILTALLVIGTAILAIKMFLIAMRVKNSIKSLFGGGIPGGIGGIGRRGKNALPNTKGGRALGSLKKAVRGSIYTVLFGIALDTFAPGAIDKIFKGVYNFFGGSSKEELTPEQIAKNKAINDAIKVQDKEYQKELKKNTAELKKLNDMKVEETTQTKNTPIKVNTGNYLDNQQF